MFHVNTEAGGVYAQRENYWDMIDDCLNLETGRHLIKIYKDRYRELNIRWWLEAL